MAKTTQRPPSIKRTDRNAPFDVLVVGAGPAGLSAALWLGRCRRRTLVLDAGEPRNAASPALHGFLTRDGISPQELLRFGRADVAKYPSVLLRTGSVRTITRSTRGFDVTTDDAQHFRARLLLLATGRADTIPDAPGFRDFYGRGVFHCAYCDGWEHRNQPIAIYGRPDAARREAAVLRTWSHKMFICTGGRTDPARTASNIPIVTTAIRRLMTDSGGRLATIEFIDGETRACRAIFFLSECVQKSDLPRQLGCVFDREGAVVCRRHAAQGVPRLFVAGNVRNGVHLAITAAAEGAEAAIAMNELLLEEDSRDVPATT